MSGTENIPKPSVEEAVRKIGHHFTEGAAEATKMAQTHGKDWLKEANKYNWRYGRYGHHCGRPGRLFAGLAIGAFGGYYFAKHYTVVHKENAEYVPGARDMRHGFWRRKQEVVEQQPPVEKS